MGKLMGVIARSRSARGLMAVATILAVSVASWAARTTVAGATVGCDVASMSITFGASGLDVGHVNAFVVFTNRGGSTCALDGFPVVHFVDAHGASIGNPSTHSGTTHHVVTLPHGASAVSLFRESVPGVFDPSACRIRAASGLRISPPGSPHAIVLRFPGTVCSGPTIHEQTVTALVAGAGPTPDVCGPTQLTATLGGSQGAAGTVYVTLVFTNPVLYTCTVHGHPAVSSVKGAAHLRVGPSATADPGTSSVVWVQPFGGTASASLGIVSTGNFTSSACGAASASGLRVAAPQSIHPTYLAYTHSVCTHLASTHVSTVVAGPAG